MDLDDAAEAPPDPLEVAFEAAANASDPGAAYLAVLTDAEHALTEAGARAKEQCVYKLAERDSKNKNFGDVAVLLERAAPFFGQVAKAKVAKIVRKLLDIVAAHADTLDLQAELCLKVVGGAAPRSGPSCGSASRRGSCRSTSSARATTTR